MLRSPTDSSPRARFAVWVLCTTASFIATLAWLWLIRGLRIIDHDARLIGGWLALGLVQIVLFALIKTTPADAIRLPRWTSVLLILGGAIILHAAALAWLWPALSEDLFRYRLDARTWLSGASPYVVAPISSPARMLSINWRRSDK